MKKTANEKLRLGLFVIIGLLLFTAGVYLIGQRQNMFGKSIEISAQFNNTNGLGHVAIGEGAGLTNDGQVYNIFIGYNAGYTNTVGSSNTFIGNQSGYTQGTVSGNVITKAPGKCVYNKSVANIIACMLNI